MIHLKNRQKYGEDGAAVTEFSLVSISILIATIGLLRILGLDVSTLYCRIVNGFGADVACSGDYIFEDDFSGDLDEWDFERGNHWEQENETLCAGPNGEHRAYPSNISGQDYTLSFDATLLRGNGYGAYFRSSGERVNGYTFQYDPGYGGGQFIIRKWVNGYEIWPPFAAARAPAGYQWYNVERHVVIDVHGNNFTVKIDGDTAVSGEDSTYTEGGIGIRVWQPSEACFDNIRLSGH